MDPNKRQYFHCLSFTWQLGAGYKNDKSNSKVHIDVAIIS